MNLSELAALYEHTSSTMQWLEEHRDMFANASSVRQILDEHPELLDASKTAAEYARAIEQMSVSPSLLAYVQEQVNALAVVPIVNYRESGRRQASCGAKRKRRRKSIKRAIRSSYGKLTPLQQFALGMIIETTPQILPADYQKPVHALLLAFLVYVFIIGKAEDTEKSQHHVE